MLNLSNHWKNIGFWGVIAFFLSCLFFPLFETDTLLTTIDHPIHYEHAAFLIERLKNLQTPYTYYPNALGGYPFLVYGYELTYWITALLHLLLRLPFNLAYKISVFLAYAMPFVPWIWLSKKLPRSLTLVGVAAIFSCLPFLQLMAYGMHAYLLGLGLFFCNMVLAKNGSWKPLPWMLALSNLAHPFAFYMSLLVCVFSVERNSKNYAKLFGCIFISMLLCFPKYYAQFQGLGWLSSGGAFFIPPLYDVIGALRTKVVGIYFLGSSLPNTWFSLAFWVEACRVLPYLALSLHLTLFGSKKISILAFALLLVACLPIFQRGTQVYLLSERIALFTLPLALLSLSLVRNPWRLTFRWKALFCAASLLSMVLTLRLAHQNRLFRNSDAILNAAKPIETLCSTVRERDSSSHGRVYVESIFRSQELGLKEESNVAAFVTSWCKREIIGAWSGDWPMPQWKLFITSESSIFGAPTKLWDAKTFTKITDLWNVEYVIAYRKETTNLLSSTDMWKKITVSGSMELWVRTSPASWAYDVTQKKPVILFEKEFDRWKLKTNSDREHVILLSKAFDPISRAYLENGQPLPIKKTDLFQPMVLVPPGNHTVTFAFAYPWWGYALQMISAIVLLLALLKKPRDLFSILRRRILGQA